MAYTLNFSIALGPANTNLTLKAQLVTSAGVNSGSEITSGFTEIGAGYYLWTHAGFPDGFRGGVKFYTGVAPGVLRNFAAINPEEAENTNAKASDIPDAVLLRDWTAIVSAVPARCLLNSNRFVRNKWVVDGSNLLTVYKENGVTVAWTADVTITGDVITAMTPN